MTNQINENDKSNQAQAGKDQHQQKTGQQTGQQQGQHGQQGKAGEATPRANAAPIQDDKNNVKKADNQNYKR
jgi:hypothetical protein